MDKKSKERINKLIEDIQYQSPQKYQVLLSIRNLIQAKRYNLVEEVKYGGLVYLFKETLLCGIFVYKNHISVEFSSGSELPDPDNILEGKGKFRRHLKIIEMKDIKLKQVKHFFELAMHYQART